MWNTYGDLIYEFRGHTGYVNSANFSPDSSKIVTASEDNTARVWDSNIESDFDKLLILGCEKLQDYLANNPNVSDENRQMCGIPPRQK